MNKFLLLTLIVSIQSSCCNNTGDGRDEIFSLMEQQEQAWNKGDIKGFMKPYWNSDSLIFIGSRGFTYGWQTTLDRYRQSYPDKVAMGQLLFENKSYKTLGKNHSLVLGRWILYREKDTLRGSYSLTWQKIDGKWQIIADHSS